MSRSTKLEHIFGATNYQPEHALEHTKRNLQARCFPLNDHTNNKYIETKIYGVWIQGELLDGGHTYLPIETRLSKHF